MRASVLACLGCMLASSANAAYCGGKPNPNALPNGYPINTAPPTLIPTRVAPNGKAYLAGEPGFEFYVAHLWGTPYELGFAHGQLFNDIAANVSQQVWAYMESQVTEYLTFLPAWLADLIANFGLDVALDTLAALDAPSTPAHFLEELHGLADGAGVDYQMLLRIHLIGELTQGDCSMYGAWGNATTNAKTFAMRALDWDTDIPAIQNPTVFVYHPTDGHAFANVGFVGWIGALSGQSSQKLSIHEIGVAFPDATFGNESFAGIPFVFLLRDILQFDNSYSDAVSRIQTSNRTCDLILGVGDGNANTARAIEYSASVAISFDDKTLQPTNTSGYTWHPRIPDIVYYGMDWLCPSYNQAMANQLLKNYGNINAATTIANIISIVQTGDVHAVVYDLTDDLLYVSFYATANSIVPSPAAAYDRQFTQLNLTALWNEQPPAATEMSVVRVASMV